MLALLAPATALGRQAHLVSLGGHGTTAGVALRGRALAGKPSSDARGRGTLRKLASTAHAFVRNDLEHVEVRVTDTATGRSWSFRTDGEGFYDARVPGPLPAGKRRFRVTLGKGKYRADPVEVRVLVVPADRAGLVVVTDIDDTVAATGVTDGKLAVVKRAAAGNAEDIRPLPGAATALAAFADAGVPVVYVSAGPVELAHRTGRFLAIRGFPAGPMFFRHYEDDGVGAPVAFKRRQLDRVLADYPGRRLVLIGDNGESDPEIYAALARDTGRVAAVYIRAQEAADPADARYAGMTLFTRWREVRRASAPLVPAGQGSP